MQQARNGFWETQTEKASQTEGMGARGGLDTIWGRGWRRDWGGMLLVGIVAAATMEAGELEVAEGR